jgi:6-pyruvoyltetrahydropterin/6-carboxytetrahydropterin synthase
MPDGILSVTKSFEFDYAHSLPDYDGICARTHGHRGVLQVELVECDTTHALCNYEGMVIDFKDLKKIVEVEVISKLDHYYLNDVIEIPTAENMVRWIVKKLLPYFKEALVRIRVYETPDSYAEWRSS